MRRATLVLLPGLDGTEVFFGPLLAALPPWVEPVVVTYPTSCEMASATGTTGSSASLGAERAQI